MVKKIVVITGGAGFIGGHLVELLISKNYKVIVLDIQRPNTNYFFKQKLNNKVEYKILDIRDKKKVQDYFSTIHPNYVIHLAAQAIVEDAYYSPTETFETNIMGTVHILDICRNIASIERIIVASSDKAYGKTKTIYTEHSPLKGDHPYDVSKSCEDLIAQTYAKTYNMPIIITRFGNVYGEGDVHFDRIIPGICKSLITNTSLQIRSNGTYVRDYVYVKDVVLGYLFLMKTDISKKGEAYNFSSIDTFSVMNLVKRAGMILHKKIEYTIQNTAKNEIPYQHLSDAKIRRLGWKPKSNFNQVFPKVYRWYSEYLSN